MRSHLLERELAARLEADLRVLGLVWYHTYRSRRSPEGFPDYVIRTPGIPVYAELKQAGKGPTPEQVEWLLYLASVNQPAFLVGGVAGVDDFLKIVGGMAKGRRLVPTALGRVVVLGDISPQGRRAVGSE